MWALYKLQAKAWLSNHFAKAEFITSILFLVVLSSLGVRNANSVEAISYINIGIIASITTLFIMNSAIYSFGFAFFEMKESVLLKRIGATKISKSKAVGSFVLWGLTTAFILLLWISLVIAIASAVGPDVSGILYVDWSLVSNMQWDAIIFGVVLTALSYLPIAFFFVSITKNSDMYNMLVTMYFFLFGFLGGAFTPNSGREWMEVISYFGPIGWTREMVTNGMLGTFNWTQEADSLVAFGQTTDWTDIGLVQMAFPLVFGLGAAGASIKTFRWDS